MTNQTGYNRETDLNTSHVSINQTVIVKAMKDIENLNTSHVSINHKFPI